MNLAMFIKSRLEADRYGSPARFDGGQICLPSAAWHDSLPKPGARWRLQRGRAQAKQQLPAKKADNKTAKHRWTERAEHAFFIVTVVVVGFLHVQALAWLIQVM